MFFFAYFIKMNPVRTKIPVILFFISNLIFGFCYAQQSLKRNIHWNSPLIQKINKERKYFLYFDGAMYENSQLPYYYELIKLNAGTDRVFCELQNLQFEPFSESELNKVEIPDSISEKIALDYGVSYINKMPYLYISFIPIIRKGSKAEKLTAFTFNYSEKPGDPEKSYRKSYTDESVLNTGDWVKIKISADGLYKITYDQLTGWGFSNPENIKVYGNGGTMLPKANNITRADDLVQNPVMMEKGGDGVFNSGDYIVFYGKGPHGWTYKASDSMFLHTLHDYSDAAYYFLTDKSGADKYIQNQSSVTNPETHSVASFTDHKFHELESLNLKKSGKLWLGEHFDILTSYDFNFSFPNITGEARIKTSVYARSGVTSNFSVAINSVSIQNIPVGIVDFGHLSTYAAGNTKINSFTPSSGSISLTVVYDKPATSSEGWLDYININANRQLKFSGGQMLFRNADIVGPGNIAEYAIVTSKSDAVVWEITNHLSPVKVETTYESGSLKFRLPADSLREFVVFDNSGFYTPEFSGNVSNQNLHGNSQVDMIIVTHPDFLTYANQLADLHRSYDDLSVLVATTAQVYNEFSSGAPDVAAIRDFVKMFYDRATNTDEMPKYLMLFGDGSFDNRSDASYNTNYILTYQSENSLSPTNSFVTDDFYGLLDDNEGNLSSGEKLDIGIGRLPVKSSEEAKNAVDKIADYISSHESLGDWRNSICFIGDDEDGNTHIDQANKLADKVYNNYPNFNVEKVFLDAYIQESTPAGQRYPDVTNAINERMRKGAIIVNYTGHGNELGLTHEKVVTTSDINSWSNPDKLPVFMTATCEFSRFDDYERTSGGELIFLNPDGGGIALYTTTRLVYSGPNYSLNDQFYNFVFEEDTTTGDLYKFGDVMKLTKVNVSGNNKRNFTLLGDPALTIAVPEYEAVTSKINSIDIPVDVDTICPDTAKALSKITISGYIRDHQKNKISDFNGILYPTIYDKAKTISTLSNDGGSSYDFKVRNNIIFKGKASITNGDFSFSFIVPKDIAYNYGTGKFSYYAYENGTLTDAAGNYQNMIIGGSLDSAGVDNQGPQIELYLNDSTFVFGGLTDQSPVVIAKVFDESGINTVGNGIGHDITLILDNNTDDIFVLNDDYQAETDNYQKGRIEHAMSELSEGSHNIKLKVWDVYNNSSEAYLEFLVAASSELYIEHVFNYPNPFTTKTSFYFDHNQPGVAMDVLVHIFTVSGKLVKTIDKQIYTDGYRAGPIDWNGLDDFGDKIGRGVYIYQLLVKSSTGSTANKYEKLVILR